MRGVALAFAGLGRFGPGSGAVVFTPGVLTLCIPVAEKAKPRRVEITASNGFKVIDA